MKLFVNFVSLSALVFSLTSQAVCAMEDKEVPSGKVPVTQAKRPLEFDQYSLQQKIEYLNNMLSGLELKVLQKTLCVQGVGTNPLENFDFGGGDAAIFGDTYHSTENTELFELAHLLD